MTKRQAESLEKRLADESTKAYFKYGADHPIYRHINRAYVEINRVGVMFRYPEYFASQAVSTGV